MITLFAMVGHMTFLITEKVIGVTLLVPRIQQFKKVYPSPFLQAQPQPQQPVLVTVIISNF